MSLQYGESRFQLKTNQMEGKLITTISESLKASKLLSPLLSY